MNLFAIAPKSGLLILFSLLGVACGGGSSGGSGSPATPPPAQPAAPVVAFDRDDATVLSGASFQTRVDGSANGAFDPAIGIDCTEGTVSTLTRNQVEFIVSDVDVLTQSVCTATVTDNSGRAASDTLTITILPMTDVGQVVGIFSPALKLALPNFNHPNEIDAYPGHVIGIAETSNLSGRFTVKAIEGTSVVPKQYFRDDIVVIQGDYLSIDLVQSPSLAGHGLPDASMSIVTEQENRIYWLVQDLQSRVFSVHETIEVSRPCFVAATDTMYGNDLVVGQVDSGLSVFDVETGSNTSNTENFDWTPIQSTGAGRSLCHMLRGIVPDSVTAAYPGYTNSPPFDPAYATPLTAIDFNTNELVFYGDVNGDNALEEMGVLPIETRANAQLDIVQVISRGSPTQSPQYLLVLLTDGNHVGEHRVVQINFDLNTNEFSQQVLHEWSQGIPVSMLQGPLGGSLEGGLYRPDLVVILGTAEVSFFFDNLLPLSDGFSLPPVYGQPALFNVGIGAGSAVAAESPYAPRLDIPEHGVLVSYPDNGNVVYITVPAGNPQDN